MYSSYVGYQITFRMVFVIRAYHVECNDMFKRYCTCFVLFDKDFINADRAGTGWQTEYERMFFRRVKGVDSIWIMSGTADSGVPYDLPIM
jgi:hypothetical protein